MAEQEVIKHTKKVYKIWTSKQHSFWHKLKEFLIEIVIIVFAVSLSIWLHERSTKKHQEEEVRQFFQILETDLLNDSTNLTSFKNELKIQSKDLYRIMSYTSIKIDSLKKINELKNWKDSMNYRFLFTPKPSINFGTYNSFESSGKLSYIENFNLRNLIVRYYSQNVPSCLEQISFHYSSLQTMNNELLNVIKYGNSNDLRTIINFTENPVIKSKAYQAQNYLIVGQVLCEIMLKDNSEIRKLIKESQSKE